jgi:C4-type Zn-finger protein
MEVKDANTRTLQGLLQQYRTELMAAIKEKKNKFELAKIKSILSEIRQLIRRKQLPGYRREAFFLAFFVSAIL